MINVDELLNGFNLWEDDPDGEENTGSVEKISSDGEVFTDTVSPFDAAGSADETIPAQRERTAVFSSTAHVGRLEQPDPEQVFVDALSDVIIPKTKPVKAVSAKPQIVVIDDDFSTLDLMKIYLQREFSCQLFDNAREAVFYLNKNVPDLIFLDCYISMVPAKKMVEIVRSYPEFKNVPIYLLSEADERGAIEAKVGNHEFEGVSGILTRPVARGELQDILNTVFPVGETA